MTLKNSFAAPVRIARFAAVAAALPVFAIAAASAQTFTVTQTLPIDTNAVGVTTSPDGKSFWIAESGESTPGNQIAILDNSTLTLETNRITVGNSPQNIAFDPFGKRAFVTNGGDNTLSVIDVATKAVTQTYSVAAAPVSFPSGVVTADLGLQVFVTSPVTGTVVPALLNLKNGLSTGRNVALAGATGSPVAVPLSCKNKALLGAVLVPVSPASGVPSLAIVDSFSAKVSKTLTLAGSTAIPEAVAVSADGTRAYVTLLDEVGNGGVWVINLLTLKTVTVVDIQDPLGYGISISPDGKYAFATGYLTSEVAVIDTKTNTLIYTLGVGDLPTSVAFSKDSSEAIVTNYGDATVSVISITK